MGSASAVLSIRGVFVSVISLLSLNLLAGEWVEHFPGGETRCARGEDFAFFVHEGTTDKVLIDFIGGGACWNADTCSTEQPTFVDSVDMVRERYEEGLEGFYDHDNPDNPVKDWTHVVVPYCTGDIHWGENDKVYTKENGEEFTIHHRGATNAKAVLKWMKENLQSPESLLVTGCSAGSYGSIYWTPHMRKAFPNAKMSQFGDSGVGVVTKDFLKQSYAYWRPDLNAPSWIPSLDPSKVNWLNLKLNDMYMAIGQHYSDLPLSQFTYSLDENQQFFHEIMGGETDVWPSAMQQNLHSLKSGLPNFDSFVTEGTDHCIVPYEAFYTDTNSEGVVFKDWFEARL